MEGFFGWTELCPNVLNLMLPLQVCIETSQASVEFLLQPFSAEKILQNLQFRTIEFALTSFDEISLIPLILPKSLLFV